MGRLLLHLRWSWRDLRARWLQVAAIALVIAIGTGLYSGLSSMAEWRRTSYDASYDHLNMWDLRVEAAEDASVPVADLLGAVEAMEGADQVTGVEARLELPTQVEASPGDEPVLVPGLIVGVDVTEGGPEIAGIHPKEGRGLTPEDSGRNVAVLDEHFASYHDLTSEGRIRVSGGRELDYVGRGLAPEHFLIVPPQGMILSEASYAVLWAPLDTVQELADRPGGASTAVLTLADGADPDRVEEQLAAALEEVFPETGFTITHRQDDQVLRYLYDDIDGDQRFNTVFALVILAGAALAAFNLTGRIVEAQRREVGIGMALGAPPALLASRPLLVSLQIALSGVVFGLMIGFVIQAALTSVLESFIPLPVWSTDFQPAVFARGALLGVILPVAATVLPVVRSVRMAPVEAIRTSHRVAATGPASVVGRLPVPGPDLVKLPVRRVLRSPRRSLATALAIGAAISVLVGVIGLMDSYRGTVDRGDEEAVAGASDRLSIDVDPAPVTSEEVRAVLDSDLLDAAEPGLTLGGILEPDGEAVDVYLSLTDLDSDLWQPTVEDAVPVGGTAGSGPGLVLARKALEDLDLSSGDTVRLRHPVREGDGIRMVESDLPIVGAHRNPFRFVAYMDIADAGLFDLEGITNTIQAVPAPGLSPTDVQRGLFEQPGVVAVEPVRAQAEAVRDMIDEFMGILTVVQVAVALLAVLIAFGAAGINVDARRREHATMFAFGLPLRSVLGANVVESLITGLAGTVLGLVAGRLLVEWLTQSLMAETLPDVGVISMVAPGTVVTAVVIGIVAVAVAPLLTVRRLRGMDIPATLRVVE